eukprot:Em0003g1346a
MGTETNGAKKIVKGVMKTKCRGAHGRAFRQELLQSCPELVFCCTCRQFLCKPCEDHHRSGRQLSKHDIIRLDQEGAKHLLAIMKPREYYCTQPNHEENKIHSYCQTCQCLIHVCGDGVPVAHKDHSITELSTIAKNHRDSIQKVLANARETVARVTGAIDANNKVREHVMLSKMKAHEASDQAFETLQQALELRKTTLLSELESISLSKTTALTLQKERFEKLIEEIGYYTEMAVHSLQTHTDHEIAALGGLIPSELSAVLKKVEPREKKTATWTSTSVAKVKTDFHVKVESKTSKGTVYPHGGLQMKAEMRSNSGAVVHGEVEDHGDGTYTTTLIPQTAGPHQLLITLNGQHVQNSPHDLNVLHTFDYKTLGNAQQVIKCRSGPYCVAIHDNGDLYIGASEYCIYVFDTTGHLKKIIGSPGQGDHQFSSSPFNIIIKDNILHVCDIGNNSIKRLTLEGTFVNKIAAKNAVGVLLDEYDRIFVSNYSDNKINVLNHNGGNIFTIDGNVTGDHSFQLPHGLAFDPLGNIHVAAYGSNTIKVFTKEGVYIRKYGDLKGPRGIAIDSEGYIFVIEYGGNCISIFDPQENIIHTVGGLNGPWGLALDSRTRSLYVANYWANVVLKFSIQTKNLLLVPIPKKLFVVVVVFFFFLRKEFVDAIKHHMLHLLYFKGGKLLMLNATIAAMVAEKKGVTRELSISSTQCVVFQVKSSCKIDQPGAERKKRSKQRAEYLQKREDILSQENKAKARARYKADPEKKKASVRDTYKADPEKKKASVRDTYNANAVSKRAAKRQRYQEGVEENRAAKRQRYQEGVEENRAANRRIYRGNSATIKAARRSRYWKGRRTTTTTQSLLPE